MNIIIPISLGLCPWDVAYIHLISYELRRGDRSGLNLGQIIHRVEGIANWAGGRELNTLG